MQRQATPPAPWVRSVQHVFGALMVGLWLPALVECAWTTLSSADGRGLLGVPLTLSVAVAPALVLSALIALPLWLGRKAIARRSVAWPQWRPLRRTDSYSFAALLVLPAFTPLVAAPFAARFDSPWVPALLLLQGGGTALAVVWAVLRRGALAAVLVAAGGAWTAVVIAVSPYLRGRWVWLHLLPAILLAAALSMRKRAIPVRVWAPLAGLSLGLGALIAPADVRLLIYGDQGFSRVYAGLSRAIADLDRDGSSALFGGQDCDDLNPAVSPLNIEIVGNGIDDNCMGGDLPRADGLDTLPLFPRDTTAGQPAPVVVISIDTLRADRVGRRRQGRPLTPNLDAFLRQSVYFEAAYAHAPYTLHSLTSLWTSSPLISATLHGHFFGYEASLGELLGRAGYRTVAVVSLFSLPWSLVLGFDEVDTRAVQQQMGFKQRPAKRTTDLAISWLHRLKTSSKALLWVHYLDPHTPYFSHPEATWLGQGIVGSYEQEIHHTDRQLARLFAALAEQGWLNRAIIVLLSDHGEMLGEHRRYQHALTVDQQAVRVPLAIRAPGLTPRRVKSSVSLLDVAPTLADLLQINRPALWRGRSLRPALAGRPTAAPVYLMAHYEQSRHPTLGVVATPYKYVVDLQRGTRVLSRIDGDRSDMPIDEPGQRKRLHHLLGRFVDQSLNDQWLRRRRRLLKQRQPKLPGKVHGAMRPLQPPVRR